MPDDRSAIVAITAGTNRVTGVGQLVAEYADGSQQVLEGPWSEGRELAHRAGLEHREDGPVGVTRAGANAPPDRQQENVAEPGAERGRRPAAALGAHRPGGPLRAAGAAGQTRYRWGMCF